jgi:4'-phosphopantetheinyl transferase
LKIKTYSYGEIEGVRNSRVLSAEEIHVWYRLLDQPIPNATALFELLSADERERARRYRFDQHRNEFILTRATLRILLGSYLDKHPEHLAFSYSAQGKPSLANQPTDMSFNVSHTEGLAALAFARGREIGVDVEKLRPECDAGKLARRFFSASERQAISHFSGRALHEAFFRCWTRKEAFIKAKGGGLSIPLDQFDVAVAEGEPAALLGTRPDPTEVSRWMLQDLPAKAGYAGALAISVLPVEQGSATENPGVPGFARLE